MTKRDLPASETPWPFTNSELHILVRSFNIRGNYIDTAVWFLVLNESIFFRTVATSHKVARMRNRPVIQIATCTEDGTQTSEFVEARATEVSAQDTILQKVDALLDQKYPDRQGMTRLMAEQNKPLLYFKVTRN